MSEGETHSPPDHRRVQQVMCKYDAEKLALSVLEIWEGGYREERPSD
jgi:hypothetical protein